MTSQPQGFPRLTTSKSSSSIPSLSPPLLSSLPPSYDDCTPYLNIRKRKNVELPLFLSKTYSMICESPPTIASWNHDGTSFYVLDSKSLSEIMIPKYFKHNNFSSFVRQLNFYGFHKVRSNSQPFTKDDDTKILQFKHPLFQRDRPELLSDIRRVGPVQVVAGTPDVELLKWQINELSAQVDYLTNTVHELKSVIKRTRSDDHGPLPKLPRLSPRWEAPLDEETLNMLMTLDRDDVPETKVEIRGAPYSHNVFKGQNISFQRGNRPEMHLSISSSAFSSQCVPRGPTDSKLTSVPLNHACAFFANLLTEYYNTPPQHNTQTTNIEDGNQSEFDYPDSLSH